jgi:hypothetical protein
MSSGPARLPTRDECIVSAQVVFARGASDVAWAYAESGGEGVARLEHEPGGLTDAQIAAKADTQYTRALRERAGAP